MVDDPGTLDVHCALNPGMADKFCLQSIAHNGAATQTLSFICYLEKQVVEKWFLAHRIMAQIMFMAGHFLICSSLFKCMESSWNLMRFRFCFQHQLLFLS